MDDARLFAQKAFSTLDRRLDRIERRLEVLDHNLGVLNQTLVALNGTLQQGGALKDTLSAGADLARAMRGLRR